MSQLWAPVVSVEAGAPPNTLPAMPIDDLEQTQGDQGIARRRPVRAGAEEDTMTTTGVGKKTGMATKRRIELILDKAGCLGYTDYVRGGYEPAVFLPSYLQNSNVPFQVEAALRRAGLWANAHPSNTIIYVRECHYPEDHPDGICQCRGA